MSELVSKTLKNEDPSLQWDLYSQRAVDTEVHLRENTIESIRAPIFSQGYSVRVIRSRGIDNNGNKISGIGICPGNILENEKDVKHAIKFALEASQITSAPSYDLPSEQKHLPSVKIVDPKISERNFESGKDLAEQVISLLDKEKDIRVTFCKIRLTKIDTVLQNCFGLHMEKTETFAYFEAGLSPKSKEIGLAEYWPHILFRRIDDLELETGIPRWCKFALDSPRAKPPETSEYDLITPPHVFSEMLPPVVTFHASASALRKGMTRWKSKAERVSDARVTITDDGLLDYGLATSPFDDEGTPQQRTELVSKGEFKNYISNKMYSSFVSPPESTGNGLRDGRTGVLSYSSDVGLHGTNTVMEQGDSSLEEMIKETKKGLLMEQFSWMLPDPITGSFGAEIRHAYLVENGSVKGAVKGGVVNGCFFDTPDEKGILNSLDLVSKDRKNGDASVLPYVRFPRLRVSG